MGIITHATVDIAKPPTEVMRWLTEPPLLAQWVGSGVGMPTDPAQLANGYTAQVPFLGDQTATLTIGDWNPPEGFTLTMDYPGGRSVTRYTLVAQGSGTTLSCDGDTDMAQAQTGSVESQLTGEPLLIRMFVHHELKVFSHRAADGDFNASAQTKMQTQLQATLDKLKTVAEAVAAG
jgi:uncharacterized protein YndB with AHSA1/START domain